MTYDETRAAFADWRQGGSANPYADDVRLRGILATYLDGARLASLEERASTFGRALVEVIGPAAARYEQRAHLPELARYDADGNRTESVVFDPAYHAAGVPVWASGLVAASGTPGQAFEQATLLYLLSWEGEAGHACPATCTIGLARALRRSAEPAVRARFLPALLAPDYAGAAKGAQFLTEVQGGSDVGANECVAEPSGDGETFLLTGEKWFCSVANADQFFVTARVPGGESGTKGLGSFVVPRTLDGRPNGFTLRRLKDKLGTRGLASGEIDFAGARAWPIGPLDQGFRTAVSVVLNTSRWMTAVGSAGIMNRAYAEARGYAAHRRAFGVAIEAFPELRRLLADMAAQSAGAVHLVMALTDLEDRIDAGVADETDVRYHRFLVNAAKYLISRQATTVVRGAIEVLGGNGTIEEFSVLPRLYRDAIVYESWEGTHNVLAAQVLNDLRRQPLLDAVEERLRAALGVAPGDVAAEVGSGLTDALDEARRCEVDRDFAAWHFRAVLDRVGVLAEAAYLARAGERAAARALLAHATPGYQPELDPDFPARVDELTRRPGATF